MKAEKQHIAIIGSGIGGLAFAYYAKEKNPNIEITIFEKEAHIGGLAMVTAIQEKKIEKFYHHIFSTDTYIVQLINDLGLGEKLHWYKDKRGTFYKGVLYPFTSAFDVLFKFTPLSFINRIRMSVVIFLLMKDKNWKKYENITADTWMQKFIGKRAYDVLWKPLLYAKFQSRYKDISMSWLWSRIDARGNSKGKLGYMNNSFGELFETIASSIQKSGDIVHTEVQVQEIKRENEHIAITYTTTGQSHTDIFDKVIVTTPAKIYTQFITGLPKAYIDNVKNIAYISAQTLILTLNHQLTPYYWISVADLDEPALVVVEQSNLIDQYNNKHIIYIGNYLQNDSSVLTMTEGELKDRYYPFLKRLNPAFDPSWVEEFRIFRAPFAQPIVDTTYHTHIPDFVSPIKDIFILTMSQVYPEDRGMNFAIKNAKQLIDKLDL